jgi:stage IV sporulation protein B
MVLSRANLESIAIKNVSCKIEEGANGGGADSKIVFKLFNLFPIKTVGARIEPERKAFLGGRPIGLSLKADGVIVVRRVEVETAAGAVLPNTGAREGDIIVKIGEKRVLYAGDITDYMGAFSKTDRVAEMVVMRDGAEVKITSYPVLEELTGRYRLGLAVKDGMDGVGTVSYIRPDGRFGSLGHAISGGGDGVIPCHKGDAYECKIIGYTRGARGEPGELKGAFVNTSDPIGEVTHNGKFGVYGNLKRGADGGLIDIGSRFDVKPGKAQIRTTVSDAPEYYDIEIIRAYSQNTPTEKGMVIRVTDAKLLNTTGGILQGMSGSPIIQNDRLVGVVTHVFVGDPAKGYAVYLDFMYDN